MLSLYGYDIDITGEYSEKTEGVVAAFQRHFRPALVDGIADMSSIETLHRLLSTLPRYALTQAVEAPRFAGVAKRAKRQFVASPHEFPISTF